MASVIESDDPPLGSQNALYATRATGGSSYRPAIVHASTAARETKSARSALKFAPNSAEALSGSRS